MAALIQVTRGSAETEDQKIAQTLLGAGQVVGRIHRAEDGIGWNLPVERRDQPLKAFFANQTVKIAFVHAASVRHGRLNSIQIAVPSIGIKLMVRKIKPYHFASIQRP